MPNFLTAAVANAVYSAIGIRHALNFLHKSIIRFHSLPAYAYVAQLATTKQSFQNGRYVATAKNSESAENASRPVVPEPSLTTALYRLTQHQYHAKIDDMIEKTLAAMSQGMINKLVSILEATLSKLSRYDEGSLIGSLLSFAVSDRRQCRSWSCGLRLESTDPARWLLQKVSGSGKEMGQAYVSFTRNSTEQIRSKVIDELWILTFFEVSSRCNSSLGCTSLWTRLRR